MESRFIKVAAAVPGTEVAECIYNQKEIRNTITKAIEEGVQIILFPELSLTGYSCADLFFQQSLQNSAINSLDELLDFTKEEDIVTIVGMPLMVHHSLLNTAIVLQRGKILGVVPKSYIPNYKEFYEERWFTSAFDFKQKSIELCSQQVPIGSNLLFSTPVCSFGIEICEDLWAPIPPSSHHATAGAEIIFNLSASNELVGKHAYLSSLIAQQSARTISAYVYSSAGFGESTTDLVFGGNALIYENGIELAHSQRFSYEGQLLVADIDIINLRHSRAINRTFNKGSHTNATNNDYIYVTLPALAKHNEVLSRFINPYPFLPHNESGNDKFNEILSIQCAGLAKRIKHTLAKSAVIGVSGGLDSTLALLATVFTFDQLGLDRKGVIGVTMPGFGTTDRTYYNAMHLMEQLGITIKEISIREACIQHFKDIDHPISKHDVVYENSQARERTQILMDIANQTGGIVVGTGDMSELALGWATYNGDHISMYGINSGIPKTLIRYLVNWIANNRVTDEEKSILMDVIDTPISPELLPADTEGRIQQKTEDLIGPYELHDFFLYYFIKYGMSPKYILLYATIAFKGIFDKETILKWLKRFLERFFSQQFKRSCLPDGPKIGNISLSPRGDWRMPSDAVVRVWLEELDNI